MQILRSAILRFTSSRGILVRVIGIFCDNYSIFITTLVSRSTHKVLSLGKNVQREHGGWFERVWGGTHGRPLLIATHYTMKTLAQTQSTNFPVVCHVSWLYWSIISTKSTNTPRLEHAEADPITPLTTVRPHFSRAPTILMPCLRLLLAPIIIGDTSPLSETCRVVWLRRGTLR